MIVVEVLFYFALVWYLPRCDCPASKIRNDWELDVQNTRKGHSANVACVLWAGRPNGSGWSPILPRTCMISTPSWLSSVHNLERLGTWCGKHNARPFCQYNQRFMGLSTEWQWLRSYSTSHMSNIYLVLVVTVQRQQSGTSGNLMCKTQLATNLQI
jgi:hypothetical protein